MSLSSLQRRIRTALGSHRKPAQAISAVLRRWPDTLAGRTLTLLIGMTLVMLVGSALLLHDERRDRFEERNLFYLLDQVTTLVLLLNDADRAGRDGIIASFARLGDTISLTDRPAVGGSRPWRYGLEHMIQHKLRAALGIENREFVRVALELDARKKVAPIPPDLAEADAKRLHQDIRTADVTGIAVSARLRDGGWVNIRTARLEEPPPWAGKTLQLLAMLLAVVIAAGLLLTRRMARPMARLADASNRLGLGQAQAQLAEEGPREIRQTIHAFNRMQERLERHIRDRSYMLAAVSHDLRTPITTLRLRAEYIDDVEMRDKTLATLAEMEAVLSAALSFARDEAADERSRPTDLGALVQSLVDDHADLGGAVSYEGPHRSIFHCRPIALKRALNNLIDNALKYANTAGVQLLEERGSRTILIEDDGPGIPEADLERVFEPFFRLETSRSSETGGTGLGLSVARTIVHAHGGTLLLANMPSGGLRAVVRLPE
ncbi:ATP-binding protein [Thiocapsa roseopersicina]|uniref:histidine kinase n=1 Tax=Thiocapsa roseopersicina TaxID=1058 RepID=A0A1H3D8R6_THIRO|nr:ATP-binding protein [Thiocapsa roseopersicina]SDX62746.1 Signal transduction histidine kinase [Thiocapsa roseopersicina]